MRGGGGGEEMSGGGGGEEEEAEERRGGGEEEVEERGLFTLQQGFSWLLLQPSLAQPRLCDPHVQAPLDAPSVTGQNHNCPERLSVSAPTSLFDYLFLPLTICFCPYLSVSAPGYLFLPLATCFCP